MIAPSAIPPGLPARSSVKTVHRTVFRAFRTSVRSYQVIILISTPNSSFLTPNSENSSLLLPASYLFVYRGRFFQQKRTPGLIA